MKTADDSQATAIVAEQVRLLYASAPGSILSSAVLAAILAVLQSDVIQPGPVFAWSALLVAMVVGRFDGIAVLLPRRQSPVRFNGPKAVVVAV